MLRATDYVIPALEILNSQIELEGRTIVDTIADNAAIRRHGAGRSTRRRPDEVDLRWVGALLYRNETIEETGLAAGVLNHPGDRRRLARQQARTSTATRLEAGEIVLAGSFTRPTWISRGDSVLADYGPLGTITCRFV